jgi:hypothetical protein
MHFIIIGGTSKAATTSLFEYLGAHPSIAPSWPKQTCFFQDEAISNTGFAVAVPFDDRSDKYLSLFKGYQNNQFLLEASPDYMYDPVAIKRIKAYCNKFGHTFQLIIILRNPVDRVISWFTFGKQQGTVPLDESFKTFLDKCKDNKEYSAKKMPYTALFTGLYSQFIEPIVKEIGNKPLIILSQEKLISVPSAYMKSLSAELNINPEFYNDFDFKNYNEAKSIRNTQLATTRRALRRNLIPFLQKSAIVRFLLQPFIWLGKKMYAGINFKPKEKIEIPPEQKQALKAYFAADIDFLEKATGQPFHWN